MHAEQGELCRSLIGFVPHCRSRRRAATSTLCGRARRSSRKRSPRSWTQIGRGGGTNGYEGGRYSTRRSQPPVPGRGLSAMSMELIIRTFNVHPARLCRITASGPLRQTRSRHSRRQNWGRTWGSSSTRPSTARWSGECCARRGVCWGRDGGEDCLVSSTYE